MSDPVMADQYSVVRGIRHKSNLDDPECRPDAEIIDGGLNYKSAIVRVSAPRGCGIDSDVEFYLDRIRYY